MLHLLQKNYNSLRPREKIALKEKYKLNTLNQSVMNKLRAKETARTSPKPKVNTNVTHLLQRKYNDLRPREKMALKEKYKLSTLNQSVMNNLRPSNNYNGSPSQWFNMVDKEEFNRRYAVELSHHLGYLPSKAKMNSMMNSVFAGRLKAHFGK